VVENCGTLCEVMGLALFRNDDVDMESAVLFWCCVLSGAIPLGPIVSIGC